MNNLIRRLLLPLRRAAWRFVLCPDTLITIRREIYTESLRDDSIVYKAAKILGAEKVEGDYLEFGVLGGKSLIRAYRIMKDVFKEHQEVHYGRSEADAAQIGVIWEKMRFFAFDSFEGLPPLDRVDSQGSDFAQGKYASSEALFRENLVRAGVPPEKVVTIPGWFEKTCTQETVRKHGIRKAAIVNIDCDLYSSTRTALDFVGPLLVDGSIIIFDDWYCFRGNPGLGEQRAFNEWKTTMKGWTFTEFQKEGPWRISFIASRPDASAL